jgi:hypothetical protein
MRLFGWLKGWKKRKVLTAVNAISTEIAVSEPWTIADRLLEEVRRSPDCELDALVQSLPDLTWEDVLLEVHRLSSTGQLQLTSWGAGIYTVRLTSAPVEKVIDGKETAGSKRGDVQ